MQVHEVHLRVAVVTSAPMEPICQVPWHGESQFQETWVCGVLGGSCWMCPGCDRIRFFQFIECILLSSLLLLLLSSLLLLLLLLLLHILHYFNSFHDFNHFHCFQYHLLPPSHCWSADRRIGTWGGMSWFCVSDAGPWGPWGRPGPWATIG